MTTPPTIAMTSDQTFVIVGAERERPYDRPPNSNGYLRGEVARDTVAS